MTTLIRSWHTFLDWLLKPLLFPEAGRICKHCGCRYDQHEPIGVSGLAGNVIVCPDERHEFEAEG